VTRYRRTQRPENDSDSNARTIRRRSEAHQPDESYSQEPLLLCSVPHYMGPDPTQLTSGPNYNDISFLQSNAGLTSTPTTDANPIAQTPADNAEPNASTPGVNGDNTSTTDSTQGNTSSSSDGLNSSDLGNGELQSTDDQLMCMDQSTPDDEVAETDTVDKKTKKGQKAKKVPLPDRQIARTGYIVAPRVAAPPKEAIKRSDEIRKRTGSPPEMHHAKVQQMILRIVDAARQSQRQIVWRTKNLAKDTKLSFFEMANEVLAFVGGCISRIRSTVRDAKRDLTLAIDAELDHMSTVGTLTGDELRQSRDSGQLASETRLLENQTTLTNYNTQLIGQFQPYLSQAQMNVRQIDLNGEAYHISLPPYGKKGPPPLDPSQPNSCEVPPGPRKSLATTKTEIDAELVAMGKRDARGFYYASQIKPVFESQHTTFQTDIQQGLTDQALNMESFKQQFSQYAMRLTTPMAQGFQEERTNERTDNTFLIEDDRHNLAESIGTHGNTLVDKFDGVIQHLDKELEPRLIKGLREAGDKAAESFRDQGKMTQRMMENTSATLALAYPQLVSRVAELIPQGQFLNYDELEPNLKAAWESTRKLPEQQYKAMAEQAAAALEQSQRAKEKQIIALGESTEKGVQQINDVVTATQYDFVSFGMQVTGVMREGGLEVIDGARDYAERMAKQMLDTMGDADGALANLIRSFCNSLNQTIDGAGTSYFTSVDGFRQRITTGKDSVYFKVQTALDEDLNTRAKTLNDELTKPDTGTTIGLGILTVVTLGAAAPITAGYLIYSDADDDEVFAAFGDLQWPGQPALTQFFKDEGYGDLMKRFDDCLSDAQASRAKGMFSQSATTRADSRESSIRNSFTVLGVDSDARRALMQGFHSSERTAAGPARMNQLVSDMRSSWTAWFTSNQNLRINEGYLRGDLGMVLSARMEISLNQARQRGSDNIFRSVQGIEQLARDELKRSHAAPFISDQQIQQLTDDAMVDFAGRHARPDDNFDGQNVDAAREIFIRTATAPIYVQRPQPGGMGHGRHPPPMRTVQVEINQDVQDYVGAVVRGGWKDEDALSAQQGYEFNRAASHSSPTRTDQVNISRSFRNQELNRLERQLIDHPEQRAQLMPELMRLRGIQEERMKRVAMRLNPPATQEDIDAAGGATEYMAQRTARLFSGGTNYDNDLTGGQSRSTTQENAQFGYELITLGRESLTSGVRLATRGSGTNDDLLRMTFSGRSKAEVAEARTQWQSRYGESLDDMLGIGQRRPMSGGMYALGLVTNPIGTLMFGRVGEISGDLADEIQISARGVPETDQDYIELAALRHQQQRQHGTGFLARLTMSGTAEARAIDSHQNDLATELLTEAIRQRNLRLQDPNVLEEDLPLPSNADGVFLPGGDINPQIAALVFQSQGTGDRKTLPRYTGNRNAILTMSNRVNMASTRYKMEIDRQERLWLAGITILAIAATLILMACGVGFVLAGVIVALGSGLLTIAVKSGMRGQRYGWEEAAMDMANTAIEVAAVGAGGALAGGLGKTGIVAGRMASFGTKLTSRFGTIGGAMAREAIVGAVSSAAQTAIQDKTYDDGPGTAFGRILLGGFKGAAIGAVSAGVSESLGKGLNRSLNRSLNNPAARGSMASLGRGLGPIGRNMVKEGISEGIGGIAGEAMGIYIELASGQYKGSLHDALKRMGQAGLKDMIRSGGRAGITGARRSRYNNLVAEARQKSNLSTNDLQALRSASIAAGEPPRTLREIQDQINIDRTNLTHLPPSMQRFAQSMDSGSLSEFVRMLQGGELGSGARTSNDRLDLLAGISEKNPQMDFSALRQQMENQTARMAQGDDVDAGPRPIDQPLRDQLTSQLKGPVKDALAGMPVRGLEHIPVSELPKVAQIIASGTLTPRQAEHLVRLAVAKNPDLDIVGFLKNLNSAVQSSRMAQDAQTRILEKQKISVLKDVPAESVGLFARFSDESLGTLRKALDEGKLPTPKDQDALFREAQAINPKLERAQFNQTMTRAVEIATSRQQQAKQSARKDRQRHMTNIPKALRSVLSVLPDSALVELHLRQMEGSMSPAEKLKLQEAALRENPDLDIKAFNKALTQAIEKGTPIRPTPEQSHEMQRQLETFAPADQRHKLKGVPVLQLPDAAFAHFTRSASGDAVTVIINGRPVVLMRKGADPKVLREEGLHALQAQDPQWAKHIGSLDETRLNQWDDLPVAMQMALYKNKLELEIDAHDRMVDDLANQLISATNPRQEQQIRLELELVQRTLKNLENRMNEVTSINPLQRLQMQAGILDRPQWLNQPARLFSKSKDSLIARVKENLVNAPATKIVDMLKNLDQLNVAITRKLEGIKLLPNQLRSLLGLTEDATIAKTLVDNMDDLAQRLPDEFRADILGSILSKRNRLQLIPKLAELAKQFTTEQSGAAHKAIETLLRTTTNRNDVVDSLVFILKQCSADQREHIATLIDSQGAHSRTEFITQTHRLMEQLSAPPPSTHKTEVLDYIRNNFTDGTDSHTHAKDIRAAVKKMDTLGELSPALLQQFATSISNNKGLTGEDAFTIHMEDMTRKWGEFSTHESTRDFAKLLDDALPQLPPGQRAVLADLHPWFKLTAESAEFKAFVAAKEKERAANGQSPRTPRDYEIDLLRDIFIQSLRLNISQKNAEAAGVGRIHSYHSGNKAANKIAHEVIFGSRAKSDLDNVTGNGNITTSKALSRIMSEMRSTAVGFTREPEWDNIVANELTRMKTDTNHITDDAHIHLEMLARQRAEYELMVDMAGRIADQRFPLPEQSADRNRYFNKLKAGLSQKVTETIGEISATQAMIKHYPDFTLLRGFEEGTGFDQVWGRREGGRIVEIIIVEAKGLNATLGTPKKGLQMGHQWTAKSITEMVKSLNGVIIIGSNGDPTDAALLLQQAVETGSPPIRGVVVTADENGDPGTIANAPGTSKNGQYDMAELKNQTHLRTPEAVGDAVRARIENMDNSEFDLRYSNDEISSIVTRGRELGLLEKEISDLMFTGSRVKKPIDADVLMTQMDTYVNIVKARGFPFKFDSIADFVNFSTDLKSLLARYGLPIDDIRIQGSSLRSQEAKDVDIAVFIDAKQFKELTDAMLAGLKSRAKPHVANSMTATMKQQIEQGRINSFYFDRITKKTFNQELRDLTKHMTDSKDIDLSLMINGRDFDISPSQKIE